MAWISHLTDRTVIALSGPDTETFLQGLITNDTGRLSETAWLYAALLTPQGKILHDFLLLKRDAVVLLDASAAGAEALVKRLSLYRLRSKVELVPRSDLAVVASAELAPGALPDPRLAELGYRAVVPASAAPPSNNAWRAHRLACGVPEGEDFGHDKIFALDAGLEELNGISFDKGCYVGQELTARMKHRATARKRLLPIVALAERGLPNPPASIHGPNRSSGVQDEIGTLASSYGARGFALIRMDRLAETNSDNARVDDVPVRIERPQWLFA